VFNHLYKYLQPLIHGQETLEWTQTRFNVTRQKVLISHCCLLFLFK